MTLFSDVAGIFVPKTLEADLCLCSSLIQHWQLDSLHTEQKSLVNVNIIHIHIHYIHVI